MLKNKDILPYFTSVLLVLVSTLVVWFPFLIRANSWYGLKIENSNMQYIYKNFDGPLYIIVAKTFYNPAAIDKIGLEVPLSNKYFAAHLPLYPLLIRIFSGVVGYLKSMIFVNVLATVILVLFLFFLLKKLKLSTKPIVLTSIFLFLPKFLVVRSIGAPESLFILLILLSLYFFEDKKYLLSGIMGGLATMTKTPGVLLFVVYSLVISESWLKDRKFNKQWLSIFLVPFGLFLVFGWYWIQSGDFLAYFHTGGLVPMPYLYSVFNSQAKWVGTAWLEEIIFYFFLYGLTVYSLKDTKYRSFFYFSLVFYIAILFVQHRDIPRYSLPLWPMALITFDKFFTSKKFLTVFIILLPAIYLYAWNFLIFNIFPVSNWLPFI